MATRWLRRLRGAIGMGLTWAAAWAIVGLLIGVSSLLLPWLPWDAFFAVFDAPLPALAVPGFVGGALFSLVLGIAARRRRFDELSLAWCTAWGALGGLLLSLVPVIAGIDPADGGGSSARLWALTAMIAGPLSFLSALSAAASLLLARRADRRDVVAGSTGERAALSQGAASGATASRARPMADPVRGSRDG